MVVFSSFALSFLKQSAESLLGEKKTNTAQTVTKHHFCSSGKCKHLIMEHQIMKNSCQMLLQDLVQINISKKTYLKPVFGALQ